MFFVDRKLFSILHSFCCNKIGRQVAKQIVCSPKKSFPGHLFQYSRPNYVVVVLGIALVYPLFLVIKTSNS